jgi:sugar phosphate isomerase/epimerase
MKFALSSLRAAQDDLSRATEFGYDGVEIAVDATAPAGIEVACVRLAAPLPNGRKRADYAKQLGHAIEVTKALGCRRLKIGGALAATGHSALATANELGQWLLPLAERAGEADITIVIENGGVFRKARDLWTLFESIDHPNLSAAWNLFNATLASESPHVSVPTLNCRVQYATVSDAKLGAAGASFCALGDGDVPVHDFMNKLRGIGYTGWISFDGPSTLAADALAKLRAWSKPADVKTKKHAVHR